MRAAAGVAAAGMLAGLVYIGVGAGFLLTGARAELKPAGASFAVPISAFSQSSSVLAPAPAFWLR